MSFLTQTRIKQHTFADSEEGKAVRLKLEFLLNDSGYNTISSYTSDTDNYPENQISFVDKHMKYLTLHRKLDTGMYLRNLQLITRIR